MKKTSDVANALDSLVKQSIDDRQPHVLFDKPDAGSGTAVWEPKIGKKKKPAPRNIHLAEQQMLNEKHGQTKKDVNSKIKHLQDWTEFSKDVWTDPETYKAFKTTKKQLKRHADRKKEPHEDPELKHILDVNSINNKITGGNGWTKVGENPLKPEYNEEEKRLNFESPWEVIEDEEFSELSERASDFEEGSFEEDEEDFNARDDEATKVLLEEARKFGN